MMDSMKFIKSGEWSHRGYIIKRIGSKEWMVGKRNSVGQIMQTYMTAFDKEGVGADKIWLWERLKDAQHAINDYLNPIEGVKG